MSFIRSLIRAKAVAKPQIESSQLPPAIDGVLHATDSAANDGVMQIAEHRHAAAAAPDEEKKASTGFFSRARRIDEPETHDGDRNQKTSVLSTTSVDPLVSQAPAMTPAPAEGEVEDINPWLPPPQQYQNQTPKAKSWSNSYVRAPEWAYNGCHGLDVYAGCQYVNSAGLPTKEATNPVKTEEFRIYRFKDQSGKWSEAVLLAGDPKDFNRSKDGSVYIGFSQCGMGYKKSNLVRYKDSEGLTFGLSNMDDRRLQEVMALQSVLGKQRIFAQTQEQEALTVARQKREEIDKAKVQACSGGKKKPRAKKSPSLSM